MPRLVRMADEHFTPAEIERRITELEGYDRLTNAQADELDLYRAARETHREQAREHRREQLAEMVERGDPAQFGERPDPSATPPGYQPSLRDDEHRLIGQGPGGALRDQARRTVDALRGRVHDDGM